MTKLYYCNKYMRFAVDSYLNIIEKISFPFSSYLREPMCKKSWISFYNVDYYVSHRQSSFFSWFYKIKPTASSNNNEEETSTVDVKPQEKSQYLDIWKRLYGSPEEMEIQKGNANNNGFYLFEKYFSFDPITEYHVLHYPIHLIFSNFKKKRGSTHIHNNLLLKYENHYLSKIVYLSNNDSIDIFSYNKNAVLDEETHSTLVSHPISKSISLYDIFPFMKQISLVNEVIPIPVSNVRFITVQYVHPKMKEPIEMVIGDEYYIDGNELFSFSFILRFLYYQKEDFYFDYNYKIEIIDSSMTQIELKWNKYILIETDSYSICFI